MGPGSLSAGAENAQRLRSSATSITEKEIVRGPGAGDAVGVAYDAIGGVLDGAIVLDVAYDAVGGVLDGAVALDVAQRAVAAVLDCAVVLQMAYDAVRCVLHRAVAFNVAYDAVGGVLDGAIVLDVGHYGVARVLDGLGAGRKDGWQNGCEGDGYDGKTAAHSGYDCCLK